jgi:hypothetical protein
VAPVICFSIVAGMAVVSPFDEWSSVPESQGGLVFHIDHFPVSSVTIADDKKKFFDVVKWKDGFPFVHQIRLKPH